MDLLQELNTFIKHLKEKFKDLPQDLKLTLEEIRKWVRENDNT